MRTIFIISLIGAILLISLVGAEYTAPSYNNVTIVLDASYTAPLYTNVTIVLGEVSAPSNTCTYSGTGNWAIQCSDNCSIASTNMNNNNITINGTGTITGFRNITSYKYGWILGGCKVYT